MCFNEYKQNQFELFWSEENRQGFEEEMKLFQEDYDDGKSHRLETWDKWYDEYLGTYVCSNEECW